MEKLEEEKLKSKYANIGGGGMGGVKPAGPGGHSQFLQKRLQKGVSWSDIILIVQQVFSIYNI